MSRATLTGSGNGPIEVPGNAYLAGPYKGAPLSMVFITGAVADQYGLASALFISSGGALVATFFALFLRESAPSRTGRTVTVKTTVEA